MNLRPYQVTAVDSIEAGWFDWQRQLLVLPTGCGKTIVFARLAAIEASQGNRVLILAHRDELIRQAADKLERSTGFTAAVEKAEETADGSLFKITVGSVQTLMRKKRLDRFAPNHYQLIIIDEAHHALSESYRVILRHFSGARVLGVTATPDRADKKSLSAVFQSVAFEYSLRQAIADRFLVPIVAQTLPLSLDLSGVKIVSGDYDAGDVGDVLAPHLAEIAALLKEHAGRRKTLVFLPLVATSKAMRDALIAVGLDARHVSGESEDRAEVLRWFAEPGPRVLCNSMLLTEGFDQPDVSCVVCLRGTKSRALYAQIIGRGTRIADGKADLLVLDFLWHSAQHNLCRPVHLVAECEEVAAAAVKIAEDSGGPVQLELLEKTASDLVRQQREAKLARKLKELAKRKAKTMDPLEFAVSLHDDALQTYEPTMRWEMAPPSAKQLATLEKFGMDVSAVTCAGFASMLLDRLIGRIHAGLSSAKQIRLLGEYGVDASNMDVDHATRILNRIAANNWRASKSDALEWAQQELTEKEEVTT